MEAHDSKEILTIQWRGEVVGHLVNALPDMWYLEGHFEPNHTQKSCEFVAFFKSFNPQEVFKKPELGTRALLYSELSPTPTHCFLISLTENILFLRRVFDSKAVKWLLENVD